MNRTRTHGSQSPDPDPESDECPGKPLRNQQTPDGGVAGDPPEAAPLSAGATRLILSDEGAGRVLAQWRVQQPDLQHLRDVFPSGTEPVPVMRLIRVTEAGEGERMARAVLTNTELLSAGQVSFGGSGGGLSVQGELGLETSAGGWLLLVRSNPVTVSAAIISNPPEVVPPESSSLRFEPALAATGTALIPVFPEVGVGAAPRGEGQGGRPLVSSSVSGSSPVVVPGHGTPVLLSKMHRPDSEAVEVGGEPGRDLANPSGALVDDGVVDDQQADTGSKERAASTSGRVGTAASPSEPSRSSSYGISEPRYGAAGDDGLEVHAQLLVHGRAKPGSEIDLFGHRIQIGSGGRFSLHLPVSNSKLLKQALDQGLPLAVLDRSNS